MEIGEPMASAYILGHNDHYTSHKFKTFFWRPYVHETMKPWETESHESSISTDEKLVLLKSQGQYIGISPVLDYIHRPKINEHVTLYDWIRLSRKKSISQKRKK
ncbi:hypothetical protein BD410DRAFT_688330, partial [Rickenella mellea]